jgi:hypothetical protein
MNTNDKDNLMTKSDWKERYKNYKLTPIPSFHPIIENLMYHVGFNLNNSKLTYFEVGHYPGSYLYSICKNLSMEANGIDFVNSDKLKEFLIKKGISVGSFQEKSIFEDKDTKMYDLVSSFGFIEHFMEDKYLDVIEYQSNKVKDGGLIYITTPNMRGMIQSLFHRIFDKENYLLHNITSMNPKSWKSKLENLGYEKIHYGYIGGFDVWIEK